MEKNEMIRRLVDAPAWLYCGRNFSYPGRNMLRLPDDWEVGAVAADVFEAMTLDLEKLRRIFTDQGEANSSPTEAGEYHSLGACFFGDDVGWSRLAVLTGKRITFAHFHDAGGAGDMLAHYNPGGSLERVRPCT